MLATLTPASEVKQSIYHAYEKIKTLPRTGCIAGLSNFILVGCFCQGLLTHSIVGHTAKPGNWCHKPWLLLWQNGMAMLPLTGHACDTIVYGKAATQAMFAIPQQR
ncbi:hypothetical protein ABBQ38_009219 [Trebouxia sp. C0009 RCD-2024]